MLEPEWDRDVLRKAQEQDEFCKFAREQLEQVNEEENELYYFSKDGIVYRREENVDKLMVPKVYVNKVLEEFHDSPLAGHQGQQKTLLNIEKIFYWTGIRTDIINYCIKCDACNRRKTSPHMKKVPLQKFTPTQEPWELTSMDIVGPLVTSMNGNRYLLTFQDYFTKYPEVIPLPDQKADTIARANIIAERGKNDSEEDELEEANRIRRVLEEPMLRRSTRMGPSGSYSRCRKYYCKEVAGLRLGQGFSTLNIFNPDDMKELAHSTMKQLWGWFTDIGIFMSGLIGVALNGFHLYKTVGCGIMLLASLWDNLTMWVTYRQHASGRTDSQSEIRKVQIDPEINETVKDEPLSTKNIYLNLPKVSHWTDTFKQ
ncbi:hypothetical protein JTB14_015634 [Gonioctena quinquepunctata]|nr:hypothetical protein JTB14_015634 [Gonioctena quinquepunctata]